MLQVTKSADLAELPLHLLAKASARISSYYLQGSLMGDCFELRAARRNSIERLSEARSNVGLSLRVQVPNNHILSQILT